MSKLLVEDNLPVLKEVERVYLVSTYGRYTTQLGELEAYESYIAMGSPDWMTDGHNPIFAALIEHKTM